MDFQMDTRNQGHMNIDGSKKDVNEHDLFANSLMNHLI